jgi:arylsulfatase
MENRKINAGFKNSRLTSLFTGTSIIGITATFMSCENAKPERPNILVIVADDMGFSDLGCFGGEISTPNLDQLAENGIRYTRFYNSGRSWPTRASLMTGYYYQAVQPSAADSRPTGWSRAVPHFLKPVGYKSYLSGKWHVHELPKPCTDAGFDHSYNTANMFNHYIPLDLSDEKPVQVDREGYYQAVAASDQAIKMLKSHKQNHAGAPFFMYLAYTVPHFPLQASREDVEKYKGRYREGWDKLREQRSANLKKLGIADCELDSLETRARWHYQDDKLLFDTFGPGEVLEAVPWETLTEEQKDFQAGKMAIHAAMVDRMDRETGRVLDQLRSSGDFDNTVIFFFSDNGCSAEMLVRGEGHDANVRMGSAGTHLCLGPGFASASNTPFRRGKIWVHEGGVSTPLIVHWGNGIKTKNELRHTPAHVVDIVPTLLDIAGKINPHETAGADYPPLHGKSIAPTFARDTNTGRDFIYFNHEGNYALTIGDWKIVTSEIDGKKWSLYDLATDRGEVNDLSEVHPERTEKMIARWNTLTGQYRAQNPNPTPPQLVDGFVKHDL